MGISFLMLLALAIGDDPASRESPQAWREAERAWRQAYKTANKDFKPKAAATHELDESRAQSDQYAGPQLDWTLQPGGDLEWRAGRHYSIRSTPEGFLVYRIDKPEPSRLDAPAESLLDAAAVAEKDAIERGIFRQIKRPTLTQAQMQAMIARMRNAHNITQHANAHHRALANSMAR